MRCERRLERDRSKIRISGGDFGLIELETGAMKQIDCKRALDPTFELRVNGRRILPDNVELGNRIGVLNDVPAVGGGRVS